MTVRSGSGSPEGDWDDASRVRVLGAESRNANGPPATSRKPAWLTLLLAMTVAGAVFMLSPRIEPPVTQDDLDTASLTGELDLTRAGAVETWTQGRIDGAPMILDVTEIDGRIVALGGEGGRAAAWMTTAGDRWEPVSLESVQSARSVISHAVEWNGNTYAYGRQGSEPTLWRAESPDRWVKEATIPPFRSAFLIDVVAGDSGLLAVTGRPDGKITVFRSDDAFTWDRLDAHGLGEAERAQAFAAHDGWFYAAGTDCTGGTCRPVVHRSADGEAWEPISIPATGTGRLTDITSSERGLVAAGVAQGEDRPTSLLLRSANGVDWERVDGLQPEFDAPETVVEVLNTDPRANAATVAIDGQSYRLASGASVRVEAMLFTVVEVGDGRLTLELPDATHTLQIGDRLTARGGVALQRVVAQGDRLVVAGAYLTEGSIPLATAAGVWSSIDGGEQWTRSTWNASHFGATVVPFTPSARILLIRGARGEINTWVSEWDSGIAG